MGKQEYRLSKSGVANPSPASKGKGARKGQGRGGGTDDPSDRPTKFPRNGQTTLDTFVESPQKRWRQLKGAPVLEVIDIDDHVGQVERCFCFCFRLFQSLV